MYGIRNLWPTLSEELEVDCEYHQDGNLRLGKNEKHAEILTNLAEKARRLGVRFISGERVIRLQMIKGKLRQVITEQTVYEGEKVLVAAGFHSREILGTIGIDVLMSQSFLLSASGRRYFKDI